MGSAQATKRRIFAIGDVHGCASELAELILRLAPKKGDTVVFLGDYVDRGPDSRGVVELILDLGETCDVVTLKGNHEAMFLDFLDHPESPGAGLFVLNGGAATLANYALDDGSIELPDKHMKFFRDLQYFFKKDDYCFVHAGLPEIPLSEINPEQHGLTMMWARTPFLNSDYDWGKLVVHGHTPVQEVEIKPNRVNIDTGCVYGGKLTALELPAMKLHQVEKMSKHAPVHYPREIDSSRISMRFSGRLPVQAQRKGEDPRPYETLNFNQFGMLLRSARQEPDYALMNGDEIEGTIGSDAMKQIKFKGTVARVEARGGFIVYGVRIDKVSDGVGGSEWIDRP